MITNQHIYDRRLILKVREEETYIKYPVINHNEKDYNEECMCVLSRFWHVWLCNPIDCSPPGSSVHVILQARILEWAALPSSRGSSWLMDQMHCRQMLSHQGSPTKNVCIVKVLVLQSCLTLCNPRDCSPPGSSVHVILQARILEWVPLPSSRGSSWLMDQMHCRQILSHWGTREAQWKLFSHVRLFATV